MSVSTTTTSIHVPVLSLKNECLRVLRTGTLWMDSINAENAQTVSALVAGLWDNPELYHSSLAKMGVELIHYDASNLFYIHHVNSKDLKSHHIEILRTSYALARENGNLSAALKSFKFLSKIVPDENQVEESITWYFTHRDDEYIKRSRSNRLLYNILQVYILDKKFPHYDTLTFFKIYGTKNGDIRPNKVLKDEFITEVNTFFPKSYINIDLGYHYLPKYPYVNLTKFIKEEIVLEFIRTQTHGYTLSLDTFNYESIFKEIKKNPQVKHLKLGICSSEDFQSLISVLPYIKSLTLKMLSINEAELLQLFSSRLKKLTLVGLTETSIFIRIAKHLQSNTQLSFLKIRNPSYQKYPSILANDGAVAFITALRINRTLKELHILNHDRLAGTTLRDFCDSQASNCAFNP